MRTTISVLFLVACSTGAKPTPVAAPEENPAPPPVVEETADDVLADFSESVASTMNADADPCADFYEYLRKSGETRYEICFFRFDKFGEMRTK